MTFLHLVGFSLGCAAGGSVLTLAVLFLALTSLIRAGLNGRRL